MQFVDGRWESTPVRTQADHPQCLGVDGKVVAGADTQLTQASMEPQVDGTLRGVVTTTVLTNECGFQGSVIQIPFVATRTGDAPSGVTLADPAAVTVSPSASTQPVAADGPVLDGTYRLDFDLANQTVAGQRTTSENSKQTQWWAFRSMCTVTRCVASGAELAETNQQQATGIVSVLHFAEGHWQDTPYLQPPKPCPEKNSTASDTDTIGLSLQPQPDGTLHGTETITALTNECKHQGDTYSTPVVATRIGDTPPTVILADPALFQTPT
jgi:serine/threonine-protein kinase